MFKKITFFLIIVLFLTSGFGCKVVNQEVKKAMEPITLEYWGAVDDSDVYENLIDKYKKVHPFVTIKYKKFRLEEYEEELLNAFAEDRGPDIFSIHNTWISKYQSKIKPMPPSITMAYPVLKGTIKSEVVPELRTIKTISPVKIKNDFADVVGQDVLVSTIVEDDKKNKIEKIDILGLPLSIDTLALFYNKDLLNNAGIASPPKYWNKDFQQNIKRLTKQDINGDIIQSGVALGGGKNIDRAPDILVLLMMQNGADILDRRGDAVFSEIPPNFPTKGYNPGLEAVRFYTDFANPLKEVYTWNETFSGSIDRFIQGKLAFLLNYSYRLPLIKTAAPKINLGVTQFPQVEGKDVAVNFANYWVETVSKKSKHPNESWDFIQFSTSADNVKEYLNITQKPSALRTIAIQQAEKDDELAVFASQVLTSKSWYKGKNSKAADVAFEEMVVDFLASDERELIKALKRAQQKINQTKN